MKDHSNAASKNSAVRPRFGRLTQIIILLVTNLVMLLVLIYGFEFYLTLANPKLRLPPEPEEVTNRFGFREREFAVPKPPGVCRIMALGDSFTWGKGIWVEERYTVLAENYLNQRYPRRKFEVLSFGHTGAHTAKERDSLARYKDTVNPDLITVGFVLNDPQPRRQTYSAERERFEERFGELFEDISNRGHDIGLGHVTDLVLEGIDRLLVKLGFIPTWQEAIQRTYEQDSPQWQEFEQALRDIKSMSDEMNLPQPIFLVLNQGAYTDRPTNYADPDEELERFLRWYHQAEKTAARLGFDPINFEREFAEQLSGQIMAANLLDLHPSPAMHRIYAQKLYEEVVEYIEEGEMCPQQFGPLEADPPQ